MTDTQGTTGFRQEGEPAFPTKDTEKDTSAASSAETTNTEQTQSQGGGEGATAAAQDAGGAKDGEGADFAKHPRWIERETDWKNRFNDQETRHVSAIADLRKEFETKYGQAPKGADQKGGASDEVPGWFGGDAKQWQEFKAWNETLVAGASKGAVTEIEQKAQKQETAVKEATDFLNAEIKVIETDKTLNPKGEKVDRNKLFKIALDNELVDTKGRWNYRAAWRIMQAAGGSVAASNTQARKEVAGATVAGGKAEPKPTSVTTSEDFSKPGARPW